MANVERIVRELLTRRAPAAKLRAPSAPGVYAIFACAGISQGLADLHPERLLYVGMTEASLELRNHFDHGNSGFSTLRRSLGAVLRDELGLCAIPRGPGASRTNVTNYRFAEEGEGRLSDWMRASLEWSFVALADDVPGNEAALIAALRPPLNLTGWPNPQRTHVMALRRQCRDEAALGRAQRDA